MFIPVELFAVTVLVMLAALGILASYIRVLKEDLAQSDRHLQNVRGSVLELEGKNGDLAKEKVQLTNRVNQHCHNINTALESLYAASNILTDSVEIESDSDSEDYDK